MSKHFPTCVARLYRRDALAENQPDFGDNLVNSYPTGLRWFLFLLSAAVPYMVVLLDDTIIATFLPILISQFQSPEDIAWYASAYFLPLTVLMPLFGKAYSLWKVKWLFFMSVSVLLLGSLLSAAADSSPSFVSGRAIAGTGAAGITSGAMRIISIASPREHRPFLEAVGALLMGICTVSGPILGGVISDSLGWRWAFWINIPIISSCLVIILAVFPAEPSKSKLFNLSIWEKIMRLDPIGTISLTIGLICLIAVLQTSSSSSKFTSSDIYLAVAAGSGLVTFVIHETFIRPDLALIPRHMITQRVVWSCCFVVFLLFAGFINYVFFLSMFFQSILVESAQESAVSLLPYLIGMSIATALTGVLVTMTKYYNPFFLMGGVCFSVGAGLILQLDAQTTVPLKIGSLSTLGIGAGLVMLANVAPCHIHLKESEHSVANGLLFFCSLLGATLSLPISSTIFNRTLINQFDSLGIPADFTTAVMHDPKQLVQLTSTQDIGGVLETYLVSIRTTFIFGLSCAIVCTLATLVVPWKPLLARNEVRSLRGSQSQVLLV